MKLTETLFAPPHARRAVSVASLNFTIGICFGSGVTLPGLLLKRRYMMSELEVSFFYLGKFRAKREITLIARGIKLTIICSHAPVAALLPALVGQDLLRSSFY